MGEEGPSRRKRSVNGNLLDEQFVLSWDRDKDSRENGKDQPAKLYNSLESSYRDMVVAGHGHSELSDRVVQDSSTKQTTRKSCSKPRA